MNKPPPVLDVFAYVIESPSSFELYDDRPGRNVLVQALRLAEVPCVFHCALSREAFCEALDSGLKEATARLQPKLPLIHLSSQGHPDGVPLSSGEMISWAELNELLRPVNTALNGHLVVSMSGCEGYCEALMAMHPDDQSRPFSALLGSSQETHWSEAAVGYAVFYHRSRKARTSRRRCEQ